MLTTELWDDTYVKTNAPNFLAMTTASAACLPLMKMKAFSTATLVPPDEQMPSGTVSVHVTAGDQRYSPSGSMTWQSANRYPPNRSLVDANS
jgi:hypothetical protein